jgi:hypothetical protein
VYNRLHHFVFSLKRQSSHLTMVIALSRGDRRGRRSFKPHLGHGKHP